MFLIAYIKDDHVASYYTYAATASYVAMHLNLC